MHHVPTDISYAIRHQALSEYIAELEQKRHASPNDRTIVTEQLAARAALLRLEREA